MIVKKEKIKVLFLLIIPSIIFNYFTLLMIDANNDLSLFSTVIITFFNLFNIFLALIYYYFNIKIFFYFLSYCLILFIFFDFSSEKLFNKNSIMKKDKELGWVLRENNNVNITQQTLGGVKYLVKFQSSSKKGFREYGELNTKNKKLLVIGDSYTGGAYSSNEKMYYSIIKNNLHKKNINIELFVLGAGGYGTIQQMMMLKEHYNKIEPDIILHQVCVNDFFDNSKNLSKLSTSQNQYYRRPYWNNGNIEKVKGLWPSFYRFLYNNSFIFKKIDQIYSYRLFLKHGRYKKNPKKILFEESEQITKKTINEIKKLVGNNVLYFASNCVTTNKELTKKWIKIMKSINAIYISDASETILNMKNENIDVMHEDGGHLNDLGNKIYGDLISKKIIRFLN